MVIPRPGLLDIPPYRLGESSVPGRRRVIQLASNECAAAPSPLAVKAYRAEARRLRRYPEGRADALCQAIARWHGLEPERIVCGNGSEELIGLLARAYAGPGDEVLTFQYGYLLFSVAARIAGATPVMVRARDLAFDGDALLAAVTPRTRLVFLANPNNPTGACLSKSEIERLWRGLPGHVLLVLDAAYAEYVTRADYEPGLQLAKSADNVVMLRTFSKVYGLASLRVGWTYGPSAVIALLHRIRPPSNVSGAAQAAASAAIEDQAHVRRVAAANARTRAAFAKAVATLGLMPQPSEGNFVLVRFPNSGTQDAATAYVFLKSRGILARRMDPYGIGDCLRFTIGNPEEMAVTVKALAAFLVAG